MCTLRPIVIGTLVRFLCIVDTYFFPKNCKYFWVHSLTTRIDPIL